MTVLSLAMHLPLAIQLPLLLTCLVPLCGGIAWAVTRRRPGALAWSVALATGTLVSAALGAGIFMSVLGIFQAAVQVSRPLSEEVAATTARSVQRVWSTAEGDARALSPVLAIVRSGRPQVAWLAVARLDCPTGCLLASDGIPSTGADAAARRVAVWENADAARVLSVGDRPLLASRAAIRDERGVPRAIAIAGIDLGDTGRHAAANAWRLLLAEVILFLLAGVGVRRLLDVTVAVRVRAATERLASRASASPAREESLGEALSTLSASVDASVERSRALEARLEDAHRLEALGRLSGGVAHDFNNLLTVIRANAQLLREDADSDELVSIDEAAARGANLVRKLLALGRNDTLQRTAAPLGPALHEALATVRRIMPSAIAITVDPAIPDGTVRIDRTAFEQIVLNLATNARDAMPDGGAFHVHVDEAALPEAAVALMAPAQATSFFRIRFSDTGHGMTPEVAAHVFEPFYTTKSREQGSGLGLAMVRGLVRSHEGWIELETARDSGTTVAVYLPRDAGALPDSVLGPARDSLPCDSGIGHVLVVEDDPSVRRTTELILRRMGWAVQVAEHGQAAIDLLRAGSVVDVILSDIMMPVMNGMEMVRMLRGDGVRTPVLLVTGYSVDDVSGFAAENEGVVAMGKPWAPSQLHEALLSLRAPQPSTLASPSLR